ncbi:MAG: sugar ABC transporter substrate-binding protein [Anaerolineae bacterium]|nr:sugar ABC transporter substrate-binding protein [Anaerolineae bacterium]
MRENRLTRRSLLAMSLKVGAGLGAMAALAACGAATPPAPSEGATSAPAAEAATQPPAAPAERIVLRYTYDETPGETTWNAKIKADYEAANPGIEVRPEPSVEGWVEKTIAAMVAGTAPDILIAWGSIFASFASRGGYEDITDTVKAWPDYDDFWPNAINELGVMDGKIYAVPYCFDPVTIFYYHEKLLDEAGVPYPNDTWTYDDFMQSCIALTKKDESGKVVQWGFNGSETTSSGGLGRAMAAVWAYGGDKYNEDMTRCLLAEPEALEAINLFWRLKSEYQASPTPEQMGGMSYYQMFASGQCAMQTTGPWAITTYLEMIQDPELANQWEVGPPPSGPKGRFAVGSGNLWGLWSGGQHKPEALALLRFMTDPDRAKEVGSIANRVPARKSAADSFGDPDKRPENESVFPAALEYALPIKYHPTKDAEVSDIIATAWEEFMILEKRTPEEALTEACAKVDKLLQEG